MPELRPVAVVQEPGFMRIAHSQRCYERRPHDGNILVQGRDENVDLYPRPRHPRLAHSFCAGDKQHQQAQQEADELDGVEEHGTYRSLRREHRCPPSKIVDAG
jgi:hypothetical protein